MHNERKTFYSKNIYSASSAYLNFYQHLDASPFKLLYSVVGFSMPRDLFTSKACY